MERDVRRLALVVSAAMIAGCGGGTTTGPTPVVYSGTYSGVMTFADDHTTTNAHTSVSQDGNTLTLTDLVLGGGAGVQAGTIYGLGSATLTGSDFSGSAAYDTSACGSVPRTYQGHFSGNTMHLKLSILASQLCSHAFDLEGDLSKG